MDGHELLKSLRRLIESHTELGCNIHQSGYKDDYFRLFRVAHDRRWFESTAHPRLTGDAISDYFYDDWLAAKNDKNDKLAKTMRAVLNMWDEWHYALEKYGVPSED
ncbi:MAG: hypothetical protein A4E71_01056 [Smithella sp. PtaU1.Bin162]|nr:MAG: hypothetical protein A4E71_01056 [Smithella sp. PtaU1.Bin162]